jgi:hypothetical protein
MLSFMAKYGSGRPWVAPETCAAAKTTSSMELKLFAHQWVAHGDNGDLIPESRRIPKIFKHKWVPLQWELANRGRVTYKRKIPDIKEDFGNDCQGLYIRPNREQEDVTIAGFVRFDDDGYRDGSLEIPDMMCVVLNTEDILWRDDQRGFGHYLLVVKESKECGKYERLGLGLAISSMRDQMLRGPWGRSRPTTSIVLV